MRPPALSISRRPRSGTSVGCAPPEPNPSSDATTATFVLAGPTAIELAVYAVTGSRVRTLTAGTWPAGTHRLSWDGRDDENRLLPAGLYWFRLAAGARTRVAGVVRRR